MEERKKVIYISGPITGVEKYWEAFERAEDDLTALGYIPLSPAHLPRGMTNAQYLQICTSMLDSADAMLMLPDWEDSHGAKVEYRYAEYVEKPIVYHRTELEDCIGWLKLDLEEVFNV